MFPVAFKCSDPQNRFFSSVIYIFLFSDSQTVNQFILWFVHIPVKHLTYARSLPWSPSPRVLHQTAFVRQRLTGCGWCKMCVSLPPCTSWVTSVPADLLPAELRRARGCLSLLFTLLGCRFRAFASGGILHFWYLFERRYQAEAFPHKSNIAPIWFSLCLSGGPFWFLCFFSLNVIVEYFALFSSYLRTNESGLRSWFPSFPLHPKHNRSDLVV